MSVHVAVPGGSRDSVVSRPVQLRLVGIPQAPLSYWLRERFFELLGGRTLGDVADVCQGLATANDARFVRFVWEAPVGGWGRPVRSRRWVPFEKGGGYGKWFGHHFWVVDWDLEGSRIKATPGPRVQNEQYYFREGWTYSDLARGSIGPRELRVGVFSTSSPGCAPRSQPELVGAILACRLASFVVRAISAQFNHLRESYVARIPLPSESPSNLATLVKASCGLKRLLVERNPAEESFRLAPSTGSSLREAFGLAIDEIEATAAALHSCDGQVERAVFAAYGVAGEDLAAVLDDTGPPAGWFALVAGFDGVPVLPDGVGVSGELVGEALVGVERRVLSGVELGELKARLRALYVAGPGGVVEGDEVEGLVGEGDEGGEGDGEGEGEVGGGLVGARIPIPTETFLEELSQRLGVHPVSVYWLLRELREGEGVVCVPELRRFIEDYLSVLVLRLLGHQWPLEVERGELVPEWVDRDGVIPVSGGVGERRLLDRVRDRLAADFGVDRVVGVEREFLEVMGVSLEAWLASGFFKGHISQFRKRPVAWQLSSGVVRRRGKRGGVGGGPVFSCLVYYHRLDADLLPKLRSQYVGPLRARLLTELADLEGVVDRSGDQDARRLQLEGMVEELRVFEDRLEGVIREGFASTGLAALLAGEVLDGWTSRDGVAPPPGGVDEFVTQEARYDPDLNDGVRVNIAPLQRAGLLVEDVLPGKDVEGAILDRAVWRGDERRWCREGKLPRPGWWPEQR